MQILDRYIISRVLVRFMQCLLLFVSLYLIGDLLGQLDDILRSQVSFKTVLIYYLNLLPEIMFRWLSPFACLISSLFTLGTLNKNNEIVAMRASGVSAWKISRVFIIFSLLISGLNFFIQESLLPSTLSRAQAIKQTEFEVNPENEEIQASKNIISHGQDNQLYFVGSIWPEEKKIKDLIIIKQDKKGNLKKVIRVENAHIENEKWIGENCLFYTPGASLDSKEETPFKLVEKAELDLPKNTQDFIKDRRNIADMDIKEVSLHLQRLKQIGAKAIANDFRVELYNKFALPFVPFVLVISSLPLGLIIKKGGGGMISVIMGFMVGVAFFGVLTLCLALGKEEILPPLASVVMPYAIFVGSGILGMTSLR